jgi:hypothetical protein
VSEEKRTHGNCGWFEAWTFDACGSCEWRPVVPMAFGFDYWPDGSLLYATADASDCPCWKAREANDGK